MEEISTDPGWGGGSCDVIRIGTGFQKDRNVDNFSHLIVDIVTL